jgi:hypothetical protein
MAKKEETKMQGDNLRYYELLRKVPDYALKQIGAGRLKGMSDINPVYRIKAMTEAFGPCGIGWKYVITKQWLETYGQEIKAFCNIDLFIKLDDEWSDAIPGTGGSSLVAMERSGAYVSDEAYKMALTDALSVAMKSLGVAADVYYSKDKVGQFDTKYEQQSYVAQQPAQQQKTVQPQVIQQPQVQQQQQVTVEQVMAEIAAAKTEQELGSIYYKYPQWQRDANFTGALTARKDQLKNNGKS